MAEFRFSDLRTRVYPVLLAGGTGTRLWPVSRQLYPKQLVKFMGDDSLIQATINRLKPIADPDHIRVVCGADHYHEIDRHLTDIGLSAEERMIVEPCGRNTAPALLLALFHICRFDKNAIVCVFPADHVIQDVSGFQKDVQTAVKLAEEGHIVTFGIKPHYPETGYGYIEGGRKLKNQGFRVKRFVEKPDKSTAEKYLKAGNFFWNSGMFTFKLSVMMDEFQTLSPELYKLMETMMRKNPVPDLKDYRKLPDISIDYAIMEHTRKAVVLPSDFGWSDIGSWKSLFDYMPKDQSNNVIVGDVVTKDTRDCFIMGQDRLIATNRVENLVVVDTADSVFISDMENSRDVKAIVSILKQNNRKEFYQHVTVYHAWGKTTQLHEDATCKVMQMTLFPKNTLPISVTDFNADQISVSAGAVTLVRPGEDIELGRGRTISLQNENVSEIKNSSNIPALLVAIRFLDGK